MNFDFPFEIIRTDRVKSASIDVEDNLVKVTVPKNLSDERIEELIKGRILWIKQKLALQATAIISKPKEYVDGEAFAYLGRNYRLKCANGSEESVKLKSGYLNVTTKNGKRNSEHIKVAIEQWYRTKALSRLIDKTRRYSAILKVEPTSINLKDYKAMWGSCSPKGVVSYNWRIILAPHKIVDYIVVHELCHLIEPNHSSKYWKQVRSVIPDYENSKEWLKNNGSSLLI
ncbi:M48 family metallopeptidase [Amylibacter sp.]|nr:M48 family metallopeptidase [Amylibacter sp.]